MTRHILTFFGFLFIALSFSANRLYAQENSESAILEEQYQSTEKDENNISDENKENKEDKDFEDLTLEELMEVQVISATRSEQPLYKAPSVVTVITREQILKRGYRSIVDILKDVMGIDIIDNVGRNELGIRGINNKSDYGKRVLMLLNGHDMSWKQFSRTRIHQAVVNIEDIKRIEIIKGPGSAVWGDSAILGIINIITRKPNEIDGFEISAGAGISDASSHNYYESIIYGKEYDIGEGLKLYFSAAGYRDNTTKDRKLKEYSQIMGESIFADGQKQSNYTLYGNISYWNLTLTGYKSKFDVYWPLASWGLTADDTRLVLDKWFTKLSFDRALTDKVRLEISGSFDRYEFGNGSQYESKPGYDGQPAMGWFIRRMLASDDFIESEAILHYNILKNLKLTGGFEYEYLDTLRWHYPEKTDGTTDQYWVDNPPEFKTSNLAGFAQGQYHPHEMLGITAGFRYDYHSVYKGVFSPRLGMVLNPVKSLTAKVLYGESFYGPSIHELYYVKKNGSYGNPELKPEIVKTYEAALEYRYNKIFKSEVTLFQNTLTDIIAYELTPEAEIAGDWGSYAPAAGSSYNQYQNIGTARVRGVETQLSANPFKALQLSVYVTYRDPVNLDTKERLENTAKISGGGVVNIFLFDKLNINFNMRYVGDRISIREIDRSNPPYPLLPQDFDRKTKPYFAADLTFRAANLFIKGFEITAGVNNIFDKEYYDPGRVEDYPQMGRNYNLNLRYVQKL
ncbi:MAG: TonB-dependent receptor [Spirochaetia bacterium]|nr:TonB-dependent receptor [Spirochaetia bacterium]